MQTGMRTGREAGRRADRQMDGNLNRRAEGNVEVWALCKAVILVKLIYTCCSKHRHLAENTLIVDVG